MRTTIHRVVGLNTVADNFAAAVTAEGGQGLDGTLKAIEHIRYVVHNYLKGFVIVISTGFALGHIAAPPAFIGAMG
jgi:hypothetical protein